ncbi:ATP-binding protein [Nonomuraea fuscirosea]|uniref:ATP-binding protein n=1 Tax=Nonomuraea fuscirosea TaxID=1291556 RepID=UPI0037B261E1
MGGDRMVGKWQAGNLPAELTSLIGRRAELEQVRQAARRSRLVTLTGVGGVGKSRLALRAAAGLRPQFSGGAWLVQLSPLVDGSLLPHAIAEALRLTDQTTRPMVEVLAEHLYDREILLVLDTCEHLVGACARTVETLLEAVPGLRVLATSRRPLDVPGEFVYVVDPLPVPPPGTSAGLGDAVALLAERAAETVPGFDLADQDQDAVIRLCRRLEGIPLAIELAAARLREMPVEQLADRLDDRFATLRDDPAAPAASLTDPAVSEDAAASGASGEAGPPWHQALRTAIGWSHELCEPAERLLWARLSVFAGDFDAEAVRRVCADELLAEADIGQLLDALAEESILTWLPTGAGERYRMLDTLREYGAGWLRGLGEEERFKQRHREHYLSLATKGAAGWLGPGQISWYDRMIGEHDNLRAAMEVALGVKDGLPALELAGTLAFFWYGCGYAKEGRHYLRQALDLDTRPGPALAQALWADGLLAATQGDADGAETRAAECERAAPEGDPYAALCVQALRSSAGVIRGDLVQAMAESEPAYLARWSGEPLTIAGLLALLCRAHAYTVDNRVDEAIAVLEDLRSLCDERGEQLMRSHGDLLRGQAELSGGRLDAAVSYGQAALRTKRRLHDSFGIGMTVDLLALAAGAAGRGLRAARLLGLAQRIWSTHGQAQASVPAWVAARKGCEAQARDLLGDNAYTVAYRTGFDSDIDAGIAYALEPEGEDLPNGNPFS